MENNKYISYITHLTSIIEKLKELEEIHVNSSFDLKWRLTELFKNIKHADEEKFIEVTGMKNHLSTAKSEEDLKIIKQESEEQKEDKPLSEINTQTNKKNVDKSWAKKLYRKAVKRCHPDITSRLDKHYQKDLESVYKEIVSAFDSALYDALMVGCYKLMLKPENINHDQIDILEKSIIEHESKIDKLLKTQAVIWYYFDEETKANFLVNFLKQNGINITSKSEVKDILRRKAPSRRTGKRPKNKLKNRVKSKNV